ncbi:MAG: TPM domain-containing protein [Gallionellaceae bacterium]|nr:TPM domain-containing protein [Gallionellaceae bacterium]
MTAASARFLVLMLLGSLLALLPSHPALAYGAPAFQGDVLDEAGLLAEADRTSLIERIKTLRDESGIWAAVYIASSLQGDSIENAAVVTFEKWQLGQAGKDNGLLVLIAPSERKMRIEVGYGLEGTLTDAFCKRVIDEIYQPAFRDQRFTDGLMQGFDVMARQTQGENPLPEAAYGGGGDATLDFDGAAFLQRFLAGVGANLLLPVLYLLARAYGRAKGRLERQNPAIRAKWMFSLFAFLGAFFGLFFAVFGFAFPTDPEVMAGLVLMNTLFVGLISIPFLIQVRTYLSASAYRRGQARERLMRMRKRSKVKRKIFGVWFDPAEVTTSRGGTKPEPRSSSGSSFGSSSSSSSSSGGGRSGGGGASGSW